MKMKIKDVNGVCIVDIEGKSISKADITKLKDLQTKYTRSKRIGINLENVQSVNIDFLDFLKASFERNKKISLYNLCNEVFLSLLVLKYDRYADIYMNKIDFKEEKHSILYRRLKLIKAA